MAGASPFMCAAATAATARDIIRSRQTAIAIPTPLAIIYLRRVSPRVSVKFAQDVERSIAKESPTASPVRKGSSKGRFPLRESMKVAGADEGLARAVLRLMA